MYNKLNIEDVQNRKDNRNIPVNKTGIKGITHPAVINDNDHQGKLISQNTIATIDMFVNLPSHVKGTHMSRFVDILNEKELILSTKATPALLDSISTRLGAQYSYFRAQFPFFIKKISPISKVESFLDYIVTIKGELVDNQCKQFVEVEIPVTTLCPCSKEISTHGAHNQRSKIIICIESSETSIHNLIKIAESEASCELFGVLKRVDEKWVTEKAFNNPKFVEDMVRDIAGKLIELNNIKQFWVSSENIESIHNHSAFAQIHIVNN